MNLKEENRKLKNELKEARLLIKRLLEELEIRENPEITTIKSWGWTPAKSGRYWRLFKRMNHRLIAIHHGKVLDIEKAREQIEKKNLELSRYTEWQQSTEEENTTG